MNIFLLDCDKENRRRILDAIDLLGGVKSIRFGQTLADAQTIVRHQDFGLVLVGPGGAEHMLTSITFLRGRLSSSLIVAYDAFDGYDQTRQKRIMDAGANSFFDVRFSPMKIAMLLRPLLGESSRPPQEAPAEAFAY